MNDKKTDLPEIPGDRLKDFSDYFEHVIDGVMLSEHIAFIQTRKFGLEADLAIDDDYDDAEVFWSLRRGGLFGELSKHIVLKNMPDEFDDFHENSLQELVENSKARDIVRKTLDPITLMEIMTLTEILDSKFLRELGIVVDADIAHNTSLNLDINGGFND